MKTFTFYYLLSIPMLQGTLPSPVEPVTAFSVAPPNDVAVFSEDELNTRAFDFSVSLSLSADCNELFNQIIHEAKQYPRYKAKAIAASRQASGGLLAWSVCKAFRVEAVDCTYGGLAVTLGLFAAFQHGFVDDKKAGAQPAEPVSTPDPATTRRSIDVQLNILTVRLESDLHESGFEFDSVYGVPSLSRRDENGLTRRVVEVRGAHRPGNDEKIDYTISSRSDGAGDVTLMPASTNTALDRRAGNTPFFKVTYLVEGRTGLPYQNGYRDGVYAAANDWQRRVEGDHQIIDYIGQHLTDKGTLSWRVAPHNPGTDGTTYEDVGKCQGK
ncbi:hypothetical protein F4821DRAFT_262178 [Hypoxylon rubiginosum]|uniref:Uncharacterized protein n=1 Tax=Hypoxylon rubiginosum TaxID=110542 RepID=A0ACC0CVH3_9PEZI|nr:hypothetical protein F4821DRAFT_262178 [Hypoxylon rubiginosum]